MAIAISTEHQVKNELSLVAQREYVALTSSGSSALIVALKASNIAPGSEVIMPAICCPAVLFAIQMAGFTPVLSDVSTTTFCSTLADIEAQVSDKTKAVVAVHSYGIACDIKAISRYCKSKQLLLIEDACLAVGATTNNQPLGSFGDISIYSFGYDKTLALNYGGAIFTNNAALFSAIEATLNVNDFFCYQPNDGNIQRLKSALDELSDFTAKRINNVLFCHQQLQTEHISKPTIDVDQPLWRYPLMINGDRERFLAKADANNILITSHYKSLEILKTGTTLPHAKYISDHVINIFVRPETPQQQIEDTVHFINEFAQ